MGRILWPPLKQSDKNIVYLEDILTKSLIHVSPRAEFVYDLHRRLLENFPQKIYNRFPQWGIAAIASLISGTMLLVMGIRSAIMILSLLGVLSHYHQRRKTEQTSKITIARYELNRDPN
jgi:hypothetical protein